MRLEVEAGVDEEAQPTYRFGIDVKSSFDPCPLQSVRARSPATIIFKDSLTSAWINFPEDKVLPLLKERGNYITVYHSPIGFKNAKARNNYLNYLKNIMEEVSEGEYE